MVFFLLNHQNKNSSHIYPAKTFWHLFPPNRHFPFYDLQNGSDIYILLAQIAHKSSMNAADMRVSGATHRSAQVYIKPQYGPWVTCVLSRQLRKFIWEGTRAAFGNFLPTFVCFHSIRFIFYAPKMGYGSFRLFAPFYGNGNGR